MTESYNDICHAKLLSEMGKRFTRYNSHYSCKEHSVKFDLGRKLLIDFSWVIKLVLFLFQSSTWHVEIVSQPWMPTKYTLNQLTMVVGITPGLLYYVK